MAGAEYRINRNGDGRLTFAKVSQTEILLSDLSGEEVEIGGYVYYILEDPVTGVISLSARQEESVSAGDQVIEVVEEYQGIRTRGVQYMVRKNAEGTDVREEFHSCREMRDAAG